MYAYTTVESWSEAFDLCRKRNAPLIVRVEQQCGDCCREVQGSGKRLHKVYPSGHAVPLMVEADERGK